MEYNYINVKVQNTDAKLWTWRSWYNNWCTF